MAEPILIRLQNYFQRASAALSRRAALLALLGAVLSIWIGLAHSAYAVPVSRRWVETKLATPTEDISNLYQAAAKSEWGDVSKWFVGNWINPKVGYYRPLTSLLYFLEYRAFGDDFTSYNRVTWLLHGLNAALLFLLTVSLFRDRPIIGPLLGMLGVWFFATNQNSMWIGVAHSIGWWPAQNDVLSLTFGLLALLLLDQYLAIAKKGWLAASLAAFCCAIFSKEMGYAVAPAAIALIWYRRRGLRREMAAFAGLGLFFFLLRRIVIVNPWAENYFSDWVARKAITYAGGPVYFLARSQVYWPILAGLAIIGLVAIGLGRKLPLVAIAISAVAVAVLCAQFAPGGGTWALLLELHEIRLLARVLAYVTALLLFVRYRSIEPGLFSLLALASVYIPILQFEGYHYKYWPGAFQGLADACFAACLLRFAAEVKDHYRAKPISAPVEEPEPEANAASSRT